MAKDGKAKHKLSKKDYGIATIAKPALMGAGVLLVIQTVMRVVLKA